MKAGRGSPKLFGANETANGGPHAGCWPVETNCARSSPSNQQFSSWRWTRLPGSAGVSPASAFSRASRTCRRDAGAPRGGRDRSAASLQTKMRIAALERWKQARQDGLNARSAAAAAVGAPLSTLYRRQKRAESGHLEPLSRRPRRVRRTQWSPAPVAAMRDARNDHPMRGKIEIAVGRILKTLVEKGHAFPVPALRRNAPRAARRKRLAAFALSGFYRAGPVETLRNAITEALILSETAVADTSGLPISRRRSGSHRAPLPAVRPASHVS